MDQTQPTSRATKTEWRAWASTIDRSSSSEAVVRRLAGWPPIHGVVMTYLAMPSEVDLIGLSALRTCRIVIPRVETATTMSVRVYDVERLEKHRLGFEQPASSATEVSPDDIDVVLLPGLVFDRSGGRLGRGRGYYDRFVEALPEATARIGVTTESSVVDAVPMDDHDQSVDWIVTEASILRTGEPLPPETARVVEAAAASGIAARIYRFPEGTRTSKDAARAVGCDLGAIAKSLVFEVDGRPVLVLCSGDRRVDEVKLASVFAGSRARPASRDRVLEITGYPAGGTPGVGHDRVLEVVADVSLARYRWVWTAGGTADTVYPVSVERLIAASNARWRDISTRE